MDSICRAGGLAVSKITGLTTGRSAPGAQMTGSEASAGTPSNPSTPMAIRHPA
jgi:hypothetical protein